jgi:hypothetical protein
MGHREGEDEGVSEPIETHDLLALLEPEFADQHHQDTEGARRQDQIPIGNAGVF